MAKGRKTNRVTPPKDETKEMKFTRVVKPRVGKALKMISLVGNCTGSGYTYTPEQASQIIIALHKAIDALEGQFAKKRDKQEDFDFKG